MKRPQTDEQRASMMECAERVDCFEQAAFELLQDTAVVETIAAVERDGEQYHASLVLYMGGVIRRRFLAHDFAKGGKS